MNEPEKKLPEKKFSTGQISATIWENEFQKDGKTETFRSIKLDKRYTDKDEKWQSTSSLNVNDVPKAILCLQEAYRYVAIMEDKIEDKK